MKIGIDARLWNEGGVGRYIRNLVEHLCILDKDNDYVLLTLAKDYGNIKYKISNIKKKWKMEDGNWKIIEANIKWHTLEEQLKLPQILNREKLDLVHFPYVSVPFFYKKPFIVTIHDLIPYHFSTGLATTLPSPLYQLKRLGYKFVISQAAKRAKKIITVSNATKDEIINLLKIDPRKIVVTYEGVLDNLKFKIQNSKIQLKSQKFFLYVGNAYPHKNLDRLIEAFKFFCHPELVSGSQSNRDSDFRQNDTKLILVGKEDYFYKRLRKKIDDSKISNIIFLHNVSDKELLSLYKNAKALVNPSLMEGFGLPALEAMANRCLVLASNIEALKEICKDAATYFDPYDTNDIVNKMKDVYYDNTYYHSDKIQKGLEISDKFSWKKMAKETLKIYESCDCV